ncbi:AsmA family protein [Wenzhouxiangella sp. EGI_FJ10305]|uniref:AsmA family protein n=1 Tax=Wenzhouxiangella sp. EGI_FJ10305 TaxID=3243768 RepID=UPI0035DFCD5B
MRRTIILAAALAIIVLGLWGTATLYFDEARMKGLFADRLSERVGRRVEIVGALRFSLFPRPEVEAEDVIIAGPEGDEATATMRAQSVRMNLRILPLLKGELAAAQMRLRGAVINLASTGSENRSSGPMVAIRSSARLLSGRSLSLQDVTLLMPGRVDGAPRSMNIDFIEFDRFSLDQNVAFRFSGDLGDPLLLDEVSVKGMLNVPASEEHPVRLRDMQLRGRLLALDEHVSLSGDLTAGPADPVRISLAGGRLIVGERPFDLSVSYHGGANPAADLLVTAEVLDWSSVRESAALSLNLELETLLAALAERIDLRSQLQFDRFRVASSEFSNARIDLRSRPEGMGVNLATVFPGGLIEASGVMTGRGADSLIVDVSLADLGQLLEWREVPPVVDGSGEATLTLSWPIEDRSDYRLEGRYELWDGYWRVGRDQGEPAVNEYVQFNGDLRMTPGYLEIPSYEITGSELSGTGWAAVELPDGTLGGELMGIGMEPSYLALSGSLTRPQLTRMAPVLPAEQGEAAPLVEDEPEQ